MASPKMGNKEMSDTATIQAVLPRNTVKRLMRLMGIPYETAKHWTYTKVSGSRRQELARKLLAEHDRQDEERARVRARLESMARDRW